MCHEEDVGAALRRVQEAGVSPQDPVRLCVIGDGAKWIWNQVKARFPPAGQILDDDHCREQVHTGGACSSGMTRSRSRSGWQP